MRLHFKGVEDGGLHDVIPAGEFLQTSFLGFPIILPIPIILLKDKVTCLYTQL